MKSTRTWTTNDGKIFATKAEAIQHEATTPLIEAVQTQAPDIDREIALRVIAVLRTRFEIKPPVVRKRKNAPAPE